MATSEHSISFQFQARYYTMGELTDHTKKIWFVLHGYGQLAQYFIRKFTPLSDSDIYVIAPEGLSKFYLEDVTSRSRTGNQKVGATWMTRENRSADISNYTSFLNTVYDHLIPKTFQGEITVLGFSQGAASAARWVTDNHIQFDRLVLWSGILPPDMNFALASHILQNKKVIEIIGNADPYVTDEKLKEMTLINNRLNINPEVIEFDGGHEIVSDVLQKLI
jgi:predicted esterase